MAYTSSGQWSTEEASGYGRPYPTRRDTSGSHDRAISANRSSRTTPRAPSDAWNVMSDSEETKQRRMSLKTTNAGASRKRSRNTLRETKKVDKPADPIDDSQWIHRDKLAQIEIMEMEQAGFPVRQSRRSSAGAGAERRSSRSRSRSRKAMPPEEQEPEPMPTETYQSYEDEYAPKRMSTIPATEEDEHYDPTTDWEIRTPEEVMAEQEINRSQVIRPSTSRIPVSKASPVPVPSNVVGRDSPLPRSRQGSTSGTWDDMQYQRKARSGSIGSQALLDDEDGVKTPPRPGSSQLRYSDENSPPKSRVPKATPNGRKGSTPGVNATQRPGSSHGNKARATPNNKDKDRTTSNGHKSRPSTSHAYNPEGDPPWISSMYKPDPRLPPDQQMLPTHAKRMMQEQWEKEGKSGTMYDRDLRLISDDPLPSPTEKPKMAMPPPLNLNQTSFGPERVPSPSKSPKPQVPAKSPTSPNSGNLNLWPLTPETERRTDPSPTSPRPGTSGGYKITPTIQSPPQIQRPEPSPAMQTSPVQRMPDYDEKAEEQTKKAGCACCVMM